MNKPTFNFLKKTFLYIALCVSGCFAASCTDDIPAENRFTFTGELITDHLVNNPNKYSKFVTILKKANISKKAQSSLFQTLSTYGSYTCFAPTNEAVDKYLAYMVEKPKSGVTSTDIELLSDSVATEIAKNHIIEKGYKTIDTPDGEFPKTTMNRRYIGIKTETGAIIIDKTAKVVEVDIETENGIIHAIDAVLNPSDKPLHEQIRQYPELSIFSEAVLATGLDALLDIYEIAPNYEGEQSPKMYVSGQGDDALSPAELRQRYTLLVEPDHVLRDRNNNHLGIEINDVDDLYTLAKEFYGNEAPNDYSDPNNALYKFVAYHILDRQLLYTGSAGGFIMENYFNDNSGFSSETNLPVKFDRYDYFETMLPYTMVKVTRPFSLPDGAELKRELVLNFAQDGGTRCINPKMEKYINVVIIEEPEIENFEDKALNGAVHTLNKILIYDEDEMAGNILNERMRWDTSSLFPEWTNNGVRWEDNSDRTCTYIPDGYSKRLVVNGVPDNTAIFYLKPHTTHLNGYTNYHGDEMLAVGLYDFEYRIPYVPAGSYEIRFGYCVSTLRAITQFYFDGKVCGIPVDLSISGTNPIIGWFDEDGMSKDEILENDKSMRNHGYMKGPASCILQKDGEKSMRASEMAIRKIIGTFKLDKGDHWLRFKNVTGSGNKDREFNQDYLELVPTSVISNPAKPEDQN
ncbi:MAG: fasciclin domain-containing protein [Bacteroidaceae bacterium]|nr:fasciclin domain-containing protein [Bacteroidaceae bacterium]